MGVSGRAILQALCEGESDPERLAKRVQPGVQASQEEIRAALIGEIREHHRFVLHELLSLIAVQDRAIEHLEEEIERHLHPFEEQITRCEKINGVSRHVLYVLSGRGWNRSGALPGGFASQLLSQVSVRDTRRAQESG